MRLPCLFTDLFIITIVIIIIIFFLGGGGGGVSQILGPLDPFFFGPLGPQFGLKIRGIRGEGALPGSVTARSLINSVVRRIKITLWKLIEVVIPRATSS